MFCKQCGNKLEEDWKACPKCGQSVNESVKAEERSIQPKKNTKKWIGIGAVAIVAVVFFILLGSSGSDGKNEAAEELVQQGNYGIYETVTIKEVLEYNWKDGKWDSFLAEKGDSEIQIVEYAKDEERNTLIQFKVEENGTEYDLVHFKIDGKACDSDEAYAQIENMYLSYFSEVYPIQNIDLAQYIEKDINKFIEDHKAFYLVDDEAALCQDISRNTSIILMNNEIYCIEIEGDQNYTPMFANIKLGDNINSIDTTALENMNYSYIPMTEEGMILYGNRDSKEGVGFGYDENGTINYIMWMRDLIEIESEYIQEPNDNIVVDYEYLYGGILDSTIINYGSGMYYALYDMNKDGYLELFIEAGTSSADLMYEVYTTNGTENTYLGSIPGMTTLYEYPDGDGIYTYYEGRDTIRIVTLVTLENGVLVENIIYEGDYENMPELDMLNNMIEIRLLSEEFEW